MRTKDVMYWLFLLAQPWERRGAFVASHTCTVGLEIELLPQRRLKRIVVGGTPTTAKWGFE